MSSKTDTALIACVLLAGMVSLVFAVESTDTFNVTFVNQTQDGDVIQGETVFNVSVNSSQNIRNVSFYHKQTGSGWNLIDKATNQTPEQTYFTITNSSSQFLSDGTVDINATARNQTHSSGVFIESSVITVTVDNTVPNGTDDLNLTSSNHTSLTDVSPLVSRLLDSGSVGLDWGNYTAGAEISDSGSGVETLELWSQNRSFNASTQEFDSWGEWHVLNSSIDPDTSASNTTSENLASDRQYRFNLSTVDDAGNDNASNIINVTLDTSGPELALEHDGTNIVSPQSWTNRTNTTLSMNITDLAGIDNSSIDVTVYRTGGATDNPSLDITPGEDNEPEYQIDTENEITQLENLTTYNVSVTATDQLSNRNESINWSFTTDFNPPAFDSIGITSESVYNGWYRDSADVDISCTAGSGESPIEQYRTGSGSWSDNSTVTVSSNGNTTYEFHCRDAAGNINQSGERSIGVDTDAPAVTSESPSGSSVDGSDVTVEILYNDEDSDGNTESGVAYNNQSLRFLEFDDTDVTEDSSTSWDADGVTYDAGSLDDGTYNVDYEVCDNVASGIGTNHCVDDSYAFSVGSSQNSQSGPAEPQTEDEEEEGQASLSLSGVPEQIALGREEQHAFDITVDNDGDTDLDDIEADLDVAEMNIIVSDTGFNLSSGNGQDVTVTVGTYDDTPGGLYQEQVSVEAQDGTSASSALDIEVVLPNASLRIVDGSGVSVEQGGAANASLDLENIGEDPTNASFSFETLNTDVSTVPGTAEIGSLASETVEAEVQPSNGTEIGIYNGSFEVQYSGETLHHTVDVKVQPDTEEERNAISSSVDALEEQFDEIEETLNNTEKQEIQELISEAQSSLEDEDYASSAATVEEIESRLEKQSGGMPWLLIAGVLVLLGVLGVGAYMVVPTEDDTDTGFSSSSLGPVRGSGGYSYDSGSGGNRLEQAKQYVKETVEEIKDKISGDESGGRDGGRGGKYDFKRNN